MTSNEGEQELPSFDIYDKKKLENLSLFQTALNSQFLHFPSMKMEQ